MRGELIPACAVSDGDHTMTITAADDGGFYIMGQVNGAPVRFVIDTGANGVLLSPADAARPASTSRPEVRLARRDRQRRRLHGPDHLPP